MIKFKGIIDVLIKGEHFTQLKLTGEQEEFQPKEVVYAFLKNEYGIDTEGLPEAAANRKYIEKVLPAIVKHDHLAEMEESEEHAQASFMLLLCLSTLIGYNKWYAEIDVLDEGDPPKMTMRWLATPDNTYEPYNLGKPTEEVTVDGHKLYED